MSEDKRKVSTDALDTLGSIIGEDCKRDAIHLAVEPVTAAHLLMPGYHVGILPNGEASTDADKLLGIVDPFLKNNVMPGERFWLIVYPRQITSLRHVWEHPDFPDKDEEARLQIARQVADKLNGSSQAFINSFAADLNMTAEELMDAASRWLYNQDYTSENTESYKHGDIADKFPEFWKHYGKITGQDVSAVAGDSFFTCSC